MHTSEGKISCVRQSDSDFTTNSEVRRGGIIRQLLFDLLLCSSSKRSSASCQDMKCDFFYTILPRNFSGLITLRCTAIAPHHARRPEKAVFVGHRREGHPAMAFHERHREKL